MTGIMGVIIGLIIGVIGLVIVTDTITNRQLHPLVTLLATVTSNIPILLRSWFACLS